MLVLRHQDRIYRVAYGMLRHREDAMEVAQDAFVRAYRSLDRFRGDAEFSTWLYRIAVNLSRNRLRTRIRRREDRTVSFDDRNDDEGRRATAEPVDPGPTPRDEAAARDFERRVRVAMEDLPRDAREILWLRNVEGASYARIAEILGCTQGTVKSRIFRARELLREALFGHESEEGM